jgi:hypothetical protein
MMGVFGRQSMQDRAISAALLSDLGPGMHPRISIRGGQFALTDAGGQRYGAPVILQSTKEGQKMIMLAIIIGSNAKKSRIFYENAYDPDSPGPPDCYSDNGLAPSANASNPQARTCAECNWSKWGSDTSALTGKKTKACDEKKKLGIIVVNDTSGLSYELQIPPATLKNMAVYANMLQSFTPPGESRKADISDFITAISFVPGQTGILEFAPFAWINSAFIDEHGTLRVALDANNQPLLAPDEGQSVGDRIDEIWESGELNDLLGLKDVPWTPPALTGPLPGMTGYLEPQGHGGALQRGSGPANPYAPPAGAIAQAPANIVPQQAPTQPQPPAAGSALPARTRKPRQAAGAQTVVQASTAPSTFPTAQATPAASVGNDDIPDFLRRARGGTGALPASAGVPAGGGPAAHPSPSNTAGHGMVEAGAPPAGIAGALATAFNLPTTRT